MKILKLPVVLQLSVYMLAFVAGCTVNTPAVKIDQVRQLSAPANPIITEKPVTVELKNLPPLLSSLTQVSISVGGAGVVSYEYTLNKEGACKEFSGNEVIPVATRIEQELDSGKYLLCVAGYGANRKKSKVEKYAWEVDLTHPAATVSERTSKVNKYPEFTAKIEGANVEKYKFKIVRGTLDSEGCADDNYSREKLVDDPLIQKLFADGNYTLCVMGISPAGVEQLLPTAFHFEQDSMLPDVLLTLNSGDTMPQIVNGSDLSLKVFAINNATSFTYKLVDGNVDCFSQKEDTFPKPSVIENDVSITLTAGELKRDIISTDPRKLKTLCVLSFKQGPENSIVKNMKVFAFFVDISGFTLPESGVTGIPANPTIESDFLNVKIMPSAGGSSFNKATSKTYQRVDVFDTREKALAPCSFDSVIPESFKDVIELKGHAKKGFYRLCLKIENSAKTAAVQRFGWIREDVVASLPLTNDKTFNRPNLANQDATSPNVLKTLTGLPKQDKASGNKFEFKFKHYVGLTLCHDNKDPYSPLASDQIDIKNLPAAGSFHTLCVLATLKGPDGTVLASQENASRFTWLRDGTKPDHTVSGIPAGTNNDTVFKVKFSAAREGKSYSPDLDAIVVLRTEILDKEAQCPARTVKDNNNKDILNPLYKEVKLNTASGEADVELTRALTAADNKKDLMFCSYSRDKSGNVASLVRMNSWTFDTRPFASLAFDPSVKMGQPSNKKTVEISVIRNPDHKGYKSKLISGLNCGTIDAGYTAFTPTTTDASFLKKTLDVSAGGDGDRTFCILAIANDNANTLQPVAEPTAFSWKLDTTPTSVELVKAPENSNLAKVDFKLTVKTSVSSESAVSYSYIALGSTTADCEKSLSSERTVKDFKTQLTLTSTLPSGAKSGSFKLCLWGHDSAGNISAAKSYTWTQKLP